MASQSDDESCSNVMSSDDVPCQSHDINPYVPTGEGEEGDFQPIKKYKPDPLLPTARQICKCTCTSMKKKTLAHIDDVYNPLAKKALAYYNAKEHSDLSFVKVNVATYQCGPKNKVHMNFTATSEDGSEKLLFSELVDGSVLKLKSEHLDEFHVKGCCLLQEVESGNPIGWGCAMCGDEIIHPGPRHGFLIVGGDLFEGYRFWGYRFLPRTNKPTPDHQKMYSACATKAVEYFNINQGTDFMATEVVGSFTSPCHHKRIVHINFKGIRGYGHTQQLFFAALVVPSFTIDSGIWDVRKEPFIVVKGCCVLEKVDSGKPFGRVCGVCYSNEVIHPGPKDGYRICVSVGEDFGGYGCMNIGRGIY